MGSSLVLPVTGWLTISFGMVRLITLSLIGFIFFSCICGISRNLNLLVVARFLQGAASGPLLPLSQTLIIAIFPPDKKTRALGVWRTVTIVGPVFGPILGGWISYDIYWPWIFFINIPLGLFAIVIIQIFLRGFETMREKMRMDWIGLALLAVGVTCLQFLLDKGEQYNWLHSPIISSCAVISLISFVFLFAWELTHKSPLLELNLLKIRSYGISVLFIMTMYATYFGGIVLIPLWLQENMGYTSIWAGIAIAPIGIIPALFSLWIARLVDKIGPLIPLFFSLIFFALSSFISAFFNTDVDIIHLMLSRFLFGFGMLFFIVPLFTLSFRKISKEKLPSATGMFHFVRAMSGGIGTSVFTTLWIRRRAFHHSNIVAQIQESRPEVSNFFHKLKALGIDQDKTWALTNDLATRQAAMLGINDCFYLMGWIFIIMIPILLLGREKKSPASALS